MQREINLGDKGLFNVLFSSFIMSFPYEKSSSNDSAKCELSLYKRKFTVLKIQIGIIYELLMIVSCYNFYSKVK